jgi:transmembrane sensor
MEEVYLKKLVARYLDKKLTDEELEIFVYLMKRGRLDSYIRQAMDADIDEQAEFSLPQRKNVFSRLNWAVAAAVAIIIGISAYISFVKFTPEHSEAKTVKINNTSGITQKQLLPDGSTVWLNPNTQLSYPSRFGKLREVKMQGEAFFEVTKDHAHPFVITSGKVLTKVWGTSFRIRSIPGEKNTEVSVLSGKVSVSIMKEKDASPLLAESVEEEVLLLPLQEAIYKPAKHQLLKAAIPASSDVIVWRKAKLSFENTRLADIALELNRVYHVQLEVQGSELQRSQLTADFTDKNLADILLLICKSLHTSYSKADNRIILRTTTQIPISIN